MARIGDMPSAEEISGGGHLIYTDDGIHASKITIEDFANAMNILMTQEVEGGSGGATGGGLVYFKEYIDQYGNVYLVCENTTSNFPSADNWKSNFQYDNWDSPYQVPNFPNYITMTKTQGGTDYIAYISFAMLHEVGTSLYDFTYDDEAEKYKIKNDEIGKIKLTVLFMTPYTNGYLDTHDTFSAQTGNFVYNPDLYAQSHHNPNGLYAVEAYDYVDLFDDYDDAANILSSIIQSSASTLSLEIAGYYKSGVVLDQLYISTEEYPDSDEYTYLDSIPDTVKKLYFSADGVNYTYYGAESNMAPSGDRLLYCWNKMFNDLINISIKGTYTIYSSQGIYFGVPYAKTQFDVAGFGFDLEHAVSFYGWDAIRYYDVSGQGLTNDVIRLGERNGNVYYYKDFIADYITSRHFNLVGDVYVGERSIVDANGVANLAIGTGLAWDFDNDRLMIDVDYLQPKLTPGSGVSIDSNNVITFNSAVQDVTVDGTSVLDPNTHIANVIVPNGLKETLLQNGSHTSVRTVSTGTNTKTIAVDIVDLENEILTASGTISASNDTGLTVCSLQIPNGKSGMFMAEVNIQCTGTIGVNDYATIVIREGSSSFPSESTLFQTDMVASKTLLQPYTAEGVSYNPVTTLKTSGRETQNGGTTAYLLIKVHSSSAANVYGKLIFVENVNV